MLAGIVSVAALQPGSGGEEGLAKLSTLAIARVVSLAICGLYFSQSVLWSSRGLFCYKKRRWQPVRGTRCDP
eukprot:SAG31_NODE_2667_length_5273_cov_2.316776_5_plen_72_part_00